MKTRFLIIAIVTLFILSATGFAYYKATDWLDFDMTTKILNKNPLSIISNGIDIQIDFTMKNYSNLKLIVSQLKVNILTPKNVLLAYQKQPLSGKVVIPANSNSSIISLVYNIPVTGLTAITKELSQTTNVGELARNYFTSGKFGIQLKMEGYVRANYGIRLPMDNVIDL